MRENFPRDAKSKALQAIINSPKKTKNSKLISKMTETITFTFDSLLQNLSNFEGKKDQDISYFLDQFHNLVEATKLPDNLKVIILKSKLLGNAKQILINTPQLKDEQNYEELKTKLLNLFKSQHSFSEAQTSFMEIKQLPTQSVEDFTKHFNIIAQKYLNSSGHASKNGAKDFLDTIKLSKYIQALRPDISFEIQKVGPDNFETAHKLAKQLEIALNNNTSQVNTLQNESHLLDAFLKFTETQNSELNSIKQQLNNLKLVNNSTQQSSDSQLITNENYCHICNKQNHTTQTCFYNKKNTASNNFQTPNYNPRFRNARHNNFRPRQSINYWPRPRNFNHWQNNPHNVSNQLTQDYTQQPPQNFMPQNYASQQFPAQQQLITLPNNFTPNWGNAQGNQFNQNPTPIQNFPNNSNFTENPNPPQPVISFPSDTNQPQNRFNRNRNSRRGHRNNLN